VVAVTLLDHRVDEACAVVDRHVLPQAGASDDDGVERTVVLHHTPVVVDVDSDAHAVPCREGVDRMARTNAGRHHRVSPKELPDDGDADDEESVAAAACTLQEDTREDEGNAVSDRVQVVVVHIEVVDSMVTTMKASRGVEVHRSKSVPWCDMCSPHYYSHCSWCY
jgi:hypothetical protein